MPGKFRRWLGGIEAAGLMAVGLAAVATMPAHATSGITQAGPFEVGNLLDYANSDFEGTTGDWTSVSNATLTDDTQSFLHNHSLLDTVPAAGTSTFKLGNGSTAVQIRVTGGATYTVGAYFKIPAVTGQSLTFGLYFYDSSGTRIGQVRTASLSLNNSGAWQYVSGRIAAPPNAASVIGSPEVTYSNATAREAINMDEAAFVPYRAAQIIGAHGLGTGTYTASDWIGANNIIGPLQSDKEFWTTSRPLPGTWNHPSNNCYGIEQSLSNPAHWPACIIAYKVRETESQLQKFLAAMPAAQQVIFVWWHEPESFSFSRCPGSAGGNGPSFVCYFEAQANNIRQAAAADGRTPQVFVAMDAATYQYSNNSSHNAGTGCSFIPPPGYTDFYFADHYDRTVNGSSLPNEGSPGPADGWNNWLHCVQGMNKPLGLAEYGLNCTTNPNQPVVTQAMAADNSYLAAIPNATEPTILWEYWYRSTGILSGPGCQFDNTAGGITQWQSIETQNGGG